MREYHELVPRDPVKNLAFRRRVNDACLESEQARQDVYEMCRADLLYYINAHCYCVEPRGATPRLLPFCTWPFQEQALADFMATFGKADACLFKSRDMGGTYITILPIAWRFLFYPMGSYLLLSRKEDAVDSGTANSLFGKLDLQFSNHPSWLLPDGFSVDDKNVRQSMRYINPELGGVIAGESTNNSAGTGDRHTIIVCDEFSRMDNGHVIWPGLAAVTDCRWATFTAWPGARHAQVLAENDQITQIRMHWSQHPLKNKGLYTSKDDVLQKLDSVPWPDGFVPTADGKLRSPWYDHYTRTRCENQTVIDTELDMKFVGSATATFDPDAVTRLEKTVVCPPFVRVNILHAPIPEGTVSWSAEPDAREDALGWLQCWFHMDRGLPPNLDLAVGIDIAMGTVDSTGRGSSNSSAGFWGRTTGEKVAELTVAGIEPKRFAQMVVASAWWFYLASERWPYLKWEANGAPGQQFGSEVVRLGYPHYYSSRNEKTLERRMMSGVQPGWWAQGPDAEQIIRDYALAVKRGVAINRSAAAVNEMRSFMLNEQGVSVHIATRHATDPTNARGNHGDRVTADKLGWSEVSLKSVAPIAKHVPARKSLSAVELGRMLRDHMKRQRVATHLDWSGGRGSQ